MRQRVGAHRRALIMLGVVVIAGVAGSFGPSSASPASRPATAAPVAAPAAKLPDPAAGFSGVVGLAPSNRATKSKVVIKIPASYAVAYLNPTYRYPKNSLLPAPKYFLPRHPKAGCRYFYNPLQADIYAMDIDQPDHNKPGVVRSVGSFPDTKVALLAFGSIPVTATLHTSQVVRNGKVQPLTADAAQGYQSLNPDGSTGCDPDWEGLGAVSTQPPTLTVSRGQLDVRISDVKVDGVDEPVGTNCRTSSPLQVHLIGEPPAYSTIFGGGTLVQKLNTATINSGGSVYPLYPESSNLVIPSFTGCVDPGTGEDVSRLITAMVSGSDNTLAVQQSMAVLNGIDNKYPSICYKPGEGDGSCATLPKNPKPPQPGK